MPIAKKPSRYTGDKILADEIINRGGSSPSADYTERKNENIKVTIRLSEKVLSIIDSYLVKSISKKTRTSWVREAVEEKINREITNNKEDQCH